MSTQQNKRNRIKWLKQRDGKNCGLCNEYLYDGSGKVNVDHIIPKSHGGSGDRSNRRLTHETCNQQRGTNDCPACKEGLCKFKVIMKALIRRV